MIYLELHAEKYREYGEDKWFFFVKRERKHEGGNLGCTDTSLTCRTRIPIRIRYFDTPILLRYRIGKVSENMRKKINKINSDTSSIHFDTSTDTS